MIREELYLIEILHQTTTSTPLENEGKGLYLIEILHQTTTYGRQRVPQKCCILSKFYIKPQHNAYDAVRLYVVSYRNSTSNHNLPASGWWFLVLYLIEILHQTTTSSFQRAFASQLYLIEILHQTTTGRFPCWSRRSLYLIEILHQTTTKSAVVFSTQCCILSKFYIKPQLVCRLGCH